MRGRNISNCNVYISKIKMDFNEILIHWINETAKVFSLINSWYRLIHFHPSNQDSPGEEGDLVKRFIYSSFSHSNKANVL